ncbi:vesicle coat component [Ascosphaera acerosa]|nr:vesicle coat component [Ascosphaera acerosa]
METPSANEYAMSPLSLQNTPQTAVGGPLPAVQETQGENIAPHASNSHQPSVMEPSPQVTAASVSQESAPGGGRLSHLRQMIFPGVAADGETVVASSPSPAPGSTGYMPPDVDAQSSPATSSDSDAASVKDKKKRAAILEDDAEFDAALMKRAAAFQKSEEKRKAKEAAQATEEASSSNAKAAQNGPPKKGWFLGWFGGGGGAKKDSAQPGKAIRAKLGEENSFYYDKELKRWVNRKDPNSTANAAAAVPPPPMARPMAASRQPSYVGSAATPPPPTSRTPTVQTPGSAPAMPASMADARLPQPRLADTVTMSVPTLRPDDVAAELGPSADNRPPAANAASAPLLPTKAQNADTLDDLLGGAPAPVPRVHTTARNKRKGRGYVDLMAK